MTWPIYIRKAAESDIASTFEYYESCRGGLGQEFLLCLDAAFSGISRNPLRYRRIYKEIMRTTIHRFPYAIYFLEKDQAVVIVAVLHIRRDPKSWQERP
jgi:toxin ParE1/3/4